MVDHLELRRQLESELERVGLRGDTLPGGGLATGPGALVELIIKLRGMEPGVTWWDVVPDLPRHWKAGEPETWTSPYRPLGPYDYQMLPTGPAILIAWSTGDSSQLETFLVLARSAGWPVYAAGIELTPGPRGSDYLARVVLKRGTAPDQLYEFGDWIDEQQGFSVAGFTRPGDEEYSDPTGA